MMYDQSSTTTRSTPLFYRLVLVLLLISALATSDGSSQAQAVARSEALAPSTIEIADPAAALTFARTSPGEQQRVLAVERYDEEQITGIDLSKAFGRPISDPIELLAEESYEAVLAVMNAAPSEHRITVPASSLTIPVDLRDLHVAAGTNFPAHGAEAGVEDGPFLFSKRVRPTGPYSKVSVGEGLLDYEVEIAWVTLAPFPRAAAGSETSPQLKAGTETAAEPAAKSATLRSRFGLMLANDFTDRATLLRHIDASDVASGKGFATGKSFPGYLPVGNLFLVPREPDPFAAELELRLFVNGVIRQQAKVARAIWDRPELLRQIWARQELVWEDRGEPVTLLEQHDRIEARTMILGGTPEGTIFDGILVGDKIGGVVKWIFGGWDETLVTNVVETYIQRARNEGIYLQPGDRVEIRVDRLGVIASEIID